MNSLRKILLVDDDNSLRASMAEVLESFGFEVTQAGNVLEAIDALRVRSSDWRALITDFCMPEIDGGELIKSVGEIGLHFDVTVLMSGLEKTDAKLRQVLAEGEVFFLKKPFGAEELLKLLKPDENV
jgi:DNA-binding NtrC family response regulator